MKVIRFPDGSSGAVVQGVRRIRVIEFLEAKQPGFVARVETFGEDEAKSSDDLDILALGRGLKQLVQKAIQLSPNIPNEASIFIENVQDPGYLADLVVPYLSVDFEAKQELLEIEDVALRLRRVHVMLTREIEILEISQRIQAEVRSEVGKQQRKFFVKEQLKLLQKELGELDGKSSGTGNEGGTLSERVARADLPKEAREAADRELERMNLMQSGSPEYMVSHTYVTWILDIPWHVRTQGEIDLARARSVLDEDHFGLEKVKRRVLDFLAVYALRKDLRGPILLLVGPPGVGKTSLGKSVARALGRKFVRIALGGVRDEAEIRGHRRTYVGSMPGRFVDALKKAGSSDPVILLDEVDKLASDFRGDPAAALLEVLDSEQNYAFVDHYLNVPVDLSNVLFIATANQMSTIPAPLRDRMEVIELGSYTLQEKTRIAYDHLLPQVVEEHGLTGAAELALPTEVLHTLIQEYTREAGVRQLRRELAGVARGVAREVVERRALARPPEKAHAKTGEKPHKSGRPEKAEKLEKAERPLKRDVSRDDLKILLGLAPFPEARRATRLPVGVATGLAWTPVGGDVLYVEAVATGGRDAKLAVTGQLGDVMQESVQTAMAFLRAHAETLRIDRDLLRSDVHVHFPAGAVKKDGPSAGVAILAALVGLFTRRPLSARVAMTGEISLRGEVLPVGGVKEKVIAAHRNGVEHVLVPGDNLRDLEEIPPEVRKALRITCIDTMEKALDVVFGLPLPPAALAAKVPTPRAPHGGKKTPANKKAQTKKEPTRKTADPKTTEAPSRKVKGSRSSASPRSRR
jgi:ATP-dependent Lon protease